MMRFDKGKRRPAARCAAGLAVVVLTLGSMLSGGCGQAESAPGEKTGSPEQQKETGTEEAKSGERGQAEEAKPEENSLSRWEAALAEGEPGAFTAEAMRGVSVVRDGEACFAVSYEPRTYKNSYDCWAISVPYQSMAVVDTEAMYAYFGILADMELTPVEDMDITREQAGVEDSTDTVFVAYYSGQTMEGGQAEPDRGILFRFGGEDAQGYRYVEALGRLWLADGSSAAKLFDVDPYACVLKMVGVVSVETVSKVTVDTGAGQYEMRIEPEAFLFGERAVESEDFYALYTALMSFFVEKELPREEWEEGETASADRELLMSITYERNMEGAPKITQKYFAYDETYAAVQVNGRTFFLVSREALMQLRERVEDAFSVF